MTIRRLSKPASGFVLPVASTICRSIRYLPAGGKRTSFATALESTSGDSSLSIPTLGLRTNALLSTRIRHKVSFHFRVLNSLRKFADHIDVISEGLADSTGYITDIVDVATGRVNDVVTKDGISTLQQQDKGCGRCRQDRRLLLQPGLARREHQGGLF